MADDKPNTEYVYITGKVKWFKHARLDEYNKWSHILYPNDESLAKVRKLKDEGMKNSLKKDEDGYYISFSRRAVLEIRGQTIPMEPPVVMLDNGQPIGDGIHVGNGSVVTTKLETYWHNVPGGNKKARAARWLSSIIHDLIPFTPERDMTESQQRAIRGLPTEDHTVFF